MSAVDHRLGGKRRQALQARRELIRRPLEHPPTAKSEQAVSHEDDRLARRPPGDMTERVTSDVQNAEGRLTQGHLIAARNDTIQRRDPPDLFWPDDLTIGLGLEPFIPARMIGMPVGIEDEIQPAPATGLELSQDRLSVRAVDRGHKAGRLVADKKAVVVDQARELTDRKGHLLYIGLMRRDVIEIRRFYATPLGQMAARLIGARLSDAWGPLTGQDVLGLGYAAPWLSEMRDARRALCAMPFAQGAEAWPRAARCRTTLVDEDALPFATGVFDRILAIHAIEEASDPLATVRELGRVLKPSGRLVLVVAGRGGLWARSENTPFGDGRPYSRGQLERLVREAELEPFAWSQALFGPPWRRLAGVADTLETWGDRLVPGAAGVVMLEAVKTQLALRAQPAAERVRPRRAESLAPQPAGLTPINHRAMDIADEPD